MLSVSLRFVRCLYLERFSLSLLRSMLITQSVAEASGRFTIPLSKRARIASLYATLFGIRSCVFIFAANEVLVPDTRLFATGRAWWSSPICALYPYLGGYWDIRAVGAIGAATLGGVVGWYAVDKGSYHLRILAVALLPPGWYACQASVDALGSAGVVSALRSEKANRTRILLGLVALVHIQSLLVALSVLAYRRIVSHSEFQSRCAALAAGVGSCLGEWHIQARYFLPGLAYALC